MDTPNSKIWTSPMPRQLARTLAAIADPKVMQNFLRDVLTEKEIIEISARLEAARLLQNGARYTEVITKTKLSSRTIARISAWLQNGKGGYRTVLKDSQHQAHIPPVSAA